MFVLPPRNLLADETSPYLHQHKDNPVHWRPWSSAALQEARQLDRPILLSVGYAACHWCHVMAHESFEDDEVATVMNRLYVNIKVDREERPDIDQIYMAALNATGEQGGWPLTMFLTPEAKPFWGGTYFPRIPRYGRPGFIQVLESVNKAWTEKRDDLARSAHTLADHVQTSLAATGSAPNDSRGLLAELANNIDAMIDRKKGGIRGAPKFPNAPFMRTLWQNWLATGNTQHRDSVLLSLRMMLAGGIYDHLAGGLSRYSTDQDWLVPHFEKMLYDNAQLIQLCCWAHVETGDDLFRIRIEETVDWLLAEMKTDNGALASSLDADSEGEEGRYYTWDRSEIESTLGPDASDFLAVYALGKPPHWEGDPVLHLRAVPITPATIVSPTLNSARQRLLAVRRKRVPPGRDDKNLTDWNALAIAALAIAGRQFSRLDWVEAAATAFAFFLRSADGDGRLPHSVRGERRLFPPLSSDLSAMATAAVRLHEATRDEHYLATARRLLDDLDSWYRDQDGTGYYLTASDSPDTPMRVRGDVDEAIPSATSQTIEALALIGDERAITVAEHAAGRAVAMRYGQAGIINASAIAYDPAKLIIIDEPGSSRFAAVAARHPDPRRVDFHVATGAVSNTALPGGALPDTSKQGAWLCTGMVCLPLIDDPDELAKALRTTPAA